MFNHKRKQQVIVLFISFPFWLISLIIPLHFMKFCHKLSFFPFENADQLECCSIYLQDHDLKTNILALRAVPPPSPLLPQGDSSICTLPGVANASLCSKHGTVAKTWFPSCFWRPAAASHVSLFLLEPQRCTNQEVIEKEV